MIFMVFFPLSVMFLFLNSAYLVTWGVFQVNSTIFEFSLILDFVSLFFGSVVVFISFCVMLFSESYMEGEQYCSRFNWLVVLFVLSMNFMIFIPNLMAVLLGWDGLGLISFCLVIYYPNFKSFNAGMLTALTNRVGDAFLLICIVYMVNTGQWCFLYFSAEDVSGVIALSIVIAAMTKSAQVPFSSWLPAAMAAPTPVSALVHSSTLVTAGVFLLIRFFPLLNEVMYIKSLLFFVGAITMFMAGLCAMFELDMKKIIALSTLSQLGVMILSLGLGMMQLALFHLLTHALFKALFFICAGSMIHVYGDNQDLRLMGSLFLYTPFSSICLSAAILALCGAPFLAGFYSKDLIIEMLLTSNFSVLSLVFMLFGTMFTVMYSVVFFYSIFWQSSNKQAFFYKSDNGNFVIFPMIFLMVGAVVGGNFFSWISFNSVSVLFLPFFLKVITLCVISFSFFFMCVILSKNWLEAKSSVLYWMYSMWFLVPVSTQGLSPNTLKVGYLYFSEIDQGWAEVFGPQGIFVLNTEGLSKLQMFQFNSVITFLWFILIFSMTLLSFFF
uniref:NADH-ubiquinone oxidoreductase chain 5 n=1 Tax=Psilodens balduri TaxID=1494734 RepID=A0A2U8LL48_9MOLL|nr:NADH dehydrogenase subunit 5 [Psilodens balduri]